MGQTIYVASAQPYMPQDAAAFASTVRRLCMDLEWGCEEFALPDPEADPLWIATKVQQDDHDDLWRDMMQVVGLAVVMSAARPEWLVEVSDDLGLLSIQLGGPLWLKAGQAVDPSASGAVPNAGQHAQLLGCLGEHHAIAGFGIPGLDASPSGAAPDLGADGEPAPAQVFTWQAPGPPPRTDRPWLARLEARVQPPDSDGDVAIQLRSEVVNGDQQRAACVRVHHQLLDAQGLPVRLMVGQDDDAWQPGEARTIHCDGWDTLGSGAVVVGVVTWVHVATAVFATVGVRATFGTPDKDGDVWAYYAFDLDNQGPALEADSIELTFYSPKGIVVHQSRTDLDGRHVPTGRTPFLVQDFLLLDGQSVEGLASARVEGQARLFRWAAYGPEDVAASGVIQGPSQAPTRPTPAPPPAPQTAAGFLDLGAPAPAPAPRRSSSASRSTPGLDRPSAPRPDFSQRATTPGLPRTPPTPTPSPTPPPASSAAQAPAPAPAPPAPPPAAGPWDLVAQGAHDAALAMFEAQPDLSAGDRQRTLALMGEADPARIALGCCIATAARWEAAAPSAQRHLRSADPLVRAAACALMGVSGRPSMVGALRPLLADPDEGVQAAAQQAIDALRG